MKRYRVAFGGGVASVRVETCAEPVPQRGQVLMRMHATSLNFRELMILQGVYPLPVQPELTPLCDGVGEIVAVGPEVSATRIGERVVGVVFARWLDGPFAYDRAEQLGGSLDGMLAEYVVLDADAALPVPAHLSDDEAATLPCAGVTAWNALTGGTALLPGATVLTQGTGGVALFALQFAKLFGARVIATTSAPDKAELLRHLGADEVVDYRAVPDWDRVVRTWTNGLGVDHAIDVGGTATWARTVASTAASGEVVLVGSVGGASAAYDPIVLRRAAATLRSVALGSRAHAVAMHRAIAAHGLRPVIDRVFAFDEAVEAYRYFATPRPPGKVVIRVA